MVWVRQYSAPNAVGARKNKSIDLLHDKSTFIRQTVPLRFEPLFGGLEATYAVPLRLIGKPVADFLLVIIELLWFRRYERISIESRRF